MGARDRYRDGRLAPEFGLQLVDDKGPSALIVLAHIASLILQVIQPPPLLRVCVCCVRSRGTCVYLAGEIVQLRLRVGVRTQLVFSSVLCLLRFWLRFLACHTGFLSLLRGIGGLFGTSL